MGCKTRCVFRLPKPEGNLLENRFRDLFGRHKLESRKPIIQARKARREVTEKWGQKDFKSFKIGNEEK
ncbi:hypothetical protein AnigIFM60653_005969 [Aspergillus niger]|nr:hypothetical protein AnigIFM50267_007805 [Aspergillus niger]GLA05481.1 hypothetical protein AnigIFM60653_005969 [Aspergillus niger]